MADVGVREFKQHLSEYLDRAARGELVRVTKRGRPTALLGPLPAQVPIDEKDQSWITPGTGEPLKPVRGWPSPRRVLDVLAEDRGG